MPVIKSAKKKMRQAEKHARHNREIKDTLKAKIKEVTKLAGKDSKEAGNKLSEAFSEIDRAAKRNIIHKNAAARKKSRLAKLIASGKELKAETKKKAVKKAVKKSVKKTAKKTK